MARSKRVCDTVVRVTGVEDVALEIATDRDVAERKVRDLHQRVGRQAGPPDAEAEADLGGGSLGSSQRICALVRGRGGRVKPRDEGRLVV